MDLAERFLRETQPEPQDQTPLKKEDVEQIMAKTGAATGTYAKAMSPSVTSSLDLADRYALEIKKERTGEHPATAKPFIPDIPFAESPIDEKFKDAFIPVKIGENDNKKGDTLLARFGEMAKPVFTALSIDEHLMLKGLYKAQGLPDKKDISNYTWTNWLRDSGAKDKLGMEDTTTDVIGLAASVALSPSTYLTFGTGASSKIGLKLALSKQGTELVKDVVRKQADEIILQTTEKAGKILAPEAENAIRTKVKQDVEQQVLKRFGEINGINKELEISADVASLPKSVISKGGAKLETPSFGISALKRNALEIPLLPGSALDKANDLYKAAKVKVYGETLVEGGEVVQEVAKSGLLKYVRAVAESEIVRKTAKSADELRNFLGKKFVVDFGVDKNLLNVMRRAGDDADKLLENPGAKGYSQTQVEMAWMLSRWEKAETEAIKTTRVYEKAVTTMFKKSGLSGSQQREFSDVLIKASVEADKEMKRLLSSGLKQDEAWRLAFKPLTHKDPMIQQALDRWIGQGKHVGNSFAQKIAQKSGLIEDTAGIPVWFPGIIESKVASLKIPKNIGEASREFLNPRMTASQAAKYTRDPVQAIGQRLTQIAYANVQDKYFEALVKKGMIKKVDGHVAAATLLQKGYVPVRRPFNKLLITGAEEKEATYLMSGAMRDAYQRLVYDSSKDIPVLTDFTRAWKRSVTTLFPSFHTRNFTSNIIMNSMRIGGHAINPYTFKSATEMALGVNLDKELKTAIGEKLTLRGILKEAEDVGVVGKGMYQADIAGATLPSAASMSWMQTLNMFANPLSKHWAPNVFGQKFGQAIEAQSRLVNYLTWRQKGLSPRLAAVEVNEALFDYQALTGFERTLNNSILPFYTFSRKNLENHAKIFAHRPGVIINQLKVLRDLGPTESELNAMPEWVKNRFIFKFRDSLYSNFGVPMEDLFEISGGMGREGLPGKELMLRLNPLIRWGVEKADNVDLFSSRRLSAVNNANEFMVVMKALQNPDLPAPIRKSLEGVKNFLGLKWDEQSEKPKVIGDPDTLHILRSGVSSRFQALWGQLQKSDRTEYEKAMQVLFGFIRVQADEELEAARQNPKLMKELMIKLDKANIGRVHETFYFFGASKGVQKGINQRLDKMSKSRSLEEKHGIKQEIEELIEEEK